MFKVPTVSENKKEKDNTKNEKDFPGPWTDLSWTMLVTWSLLPR